MLQRQHLASRMGSESLTRRLEKEAKWRSGRKQHRRLRFRYRLLRMFLKLTGLWQAGRAGFVDLKLVQNRVAIPKLPAAFDGFRILQITDIHIDLDLTLAERIVQIGATADYDICVHTGDFENRNLLGTPGAVDALDRCIETLHGPHFCVPGNHDRIELFAPLERMGMRLLLNESEPIARGDSRLWIAGVDDSHFFKSSDLTRALRNIPSGETVVLLSHSPCICNEALEAGVSFQLSGHTHGGQICLPGGYALLGHTRLERKYWSGSWSRGGLQGYTSTGAGGCQLPIRLNCPPELTLHRLECA